jgi:hypothetical protein
MDPSTLKKESKQERIQRLVCKYQQELQENLTEGPQTLEEIEAEVSKIGKRVQKDLQEEKLHHLGSGYTHDRLPCGCGSRASYQTDYRRRLLTLHGAFTLSRAYYYCRACKQGNCPLDTVLGLDKGETSIGLRGLVARLSAYMPDRKATTEAALLCGVRLAPATTQRLSRAVGEQLAREWQAQEKRVWAGRSPDPDRPIGRLHASMDGVFVHVDKQWREVKVGVAYERGDAGVERAGYYATLAKSADFGRRWRTLAHQAGSGKCRQWAVVADGAEWIWQEAGKYAATRVQILDFYHAVEHLWVVARARFGEGSAGASQWISEQKERLLTDKVGEVIADIASWSPTSKVGEEIRLGQLAYLRTHQHRMRYQTFRESGWHIGSGVMEASCKAVVQGRMKGVGMHWSAGGAEAMLHVRAAWCTSQETDFTAIARRAAMPA